MPQITVESLQKKIAEIEKQQEELIARLNAISGAKQVLDALVAELTAPDTSGLSEN